MANPQPEDGYTRIGHEVARCPQCITRLDSMEADLSIETELGKENPLS